jgi:hypothetical protein
MATSGGGDTMTRGHAAVNSGGGDTMERGHLLAVWLRLLLGVFV